VYKLEQQAAFQQEKLNTAARQSYQLYVPTCVLPVCVFPVSPDCSGPTPVVSPHIYTFMLCLVPLPYCLCNIPPEFTSPSSLSFKCSFKCSFQSTFFPLLCTLPVKLTVALPHLDSCLLLCAGVFDPSHPVVTLFGEYSKDHQDQVPDLG